MTWSFRVALAVVAGWAAWVFLSGHDTVCTNTVVNDHVERVCNPIAVGDARFVAVAALMVVLASYERDVEFGGLKLSRLKKLEKEVADVGDSVSALHQTLTQTLASVATANASSRADGGDARIYIGIDEVGRVQNRAFSSDAVPDATVASSGLMTSAAVGWWSYAPENLDESGCLLLLVTEPLVGLVPLMISGDEALAYEVIPRLTGEGGVAVKACATKDAVIASVPGSEVVTGDPVVIVAAGAFGPSGTALGAVVVAGRGAELDESGIAAYVEAVADEWALVIPHLQARTTEADGHHEGETAQ